MAAAQDVILPRFRLLTPEFWNLVFDCGFLTRRKGFPIRAESINKPSKPYAQLCICADQ